MDEFNAYLIGVGGQGIGLLSELLIRAADHAGLRVKGVDTHGLAQRGGTVISHLRMGDRVSSSMVPLGKTEPVGEDQIQALCQRKGLRLYKVHVPELSEPRMQNIVVLATVSKNGLIPNVLDLHYRRAMEDLLTGEMLRENMALFDLKSGGD